MPARKAPARRKRPAPAQDEKKRDVTRRHLFACALELFQQRGVDATTMRDIAKAAGMSLGAAYYYFPSKEALVFAYYEDNQAEAEAAEARATGSVRARLGTVLHAKLDSIAPYKKMLAAIVRRLIDPSDPVGAFAPETARVRDRSIAVFERVLATSALPDASRGLVARALWMFQMGIMLVFINDASPGETRTHGLVDDALDMLVPMLPLLATPMGTALVERLTAALARAGIETA